MDKARSAVQAAAIQRAKGNAANAAKLLNVKLGQLKLLDIEGVHEKNFGNYL